MVTGAVKAIIDVSKDSQDSNASRSPLYQRALRLQNSNVYIVADIKVLENLECSLVIHDKDNTMDGNVGVVGQWLMESYGDGAELEKQYTALPIETFVDRKTHTDMDMPFGVVVLRRKHLVPLNGGNQSFKKVLTTLED